VELKCRATDDDVHRELKEENVGAGLVPARPSVPEHHGITGGQGQALPLHYLPSAHGGHHHPSRGTSTPQLFNVESGVALFTINLSFSA